MANITKSELAALKLTLMTEHNTATRSLTDEAIVKLAYTKAIITKTDLNDYLGEQAVEVATATPAETPAQTAIEQPQQEKEEEQVSDLAPTQPNPQDAMRQMTALMSQVFQQPNSGMTEDMVIKLINEHSPVKRIEAVTTTGETIQIEDTTHECFEDALNMLGCGLDIYFYGRSGAGKSHTSRQLAKALDIPFFSQGSILAKFEALGSLTANGYNKSVIRQWLESDGGLLCIDEIDGSCPRALVTIMAIFDETGSLTFPDGETLSRTPQHRVILTANTTGAGASAQYNGRLRLDKATLNRFVYLEHDYSRQVEDSIADSEITKYGRKYRAQVEKMGLDGALVTPRTFKQAQKIKSSNLSVTNKMNAIKKVFQQALTDEQFRNVNDKIPAFQLRA